MGIHDKKGNHIEQLSIKDNIMKSLIEKDKLKIKEDNRLDYIQRNVTPGVYFTIKG